jgi:predicted RNA-binding protein associated with RNAse of E/G family
MHYNDIDHVFSAMKNGKVTKFVDPKGFLYIGKINAIMREDGSGKNWIITLAYGNVVKQIFIHAA